MSVHKMRIAILGCGNMGTALAEQLGPLHQFFLHDRDWHWTQQLAEKVKGKPFQDPIEAVKNAQLIFLAIKPQNLHELAAKISPHLKEDQIVASLLAGTTLARLKEHLPTPLLVRLMPNLALRHGKGVTGVVDCPSLSAQLKQKLTELLTPLGLVYWLKEERIDALTSLTGSGPAFILTLIEAMIEAGCAMGFQKEDSRHLVLQTLQGCTALLQKNEKSPAELVKEIASPKGTTVAGLKVLEESRVKEILIETFLATLGRAQEMAKSRLD